MPNFLNPSSLTNNSIFLFNLDKNSTSDLGSSMEFYQNPSNISKNNNSSKNSLNQLNNILGVPKPTILIKTNSMDFQL
jgi:hypothetical protein